MQADFAKRFYLVNPSNFAVDATLFVFIDNVGAYYFDIFLMQSNPLARRRQFLAANNKFSWFGNLVAVYFKVNFTHLLLYSLTFDIICVSVGRQWSTFLMLIH